MGRRFSNAVTSRQCRNVECNLFSGLNLYMKRTIFFLFATLSLFGCKKNDNSPSNQIIGTWTFRTQISGVFQYPYPYPEIYWNFSIQPLVVNYTNSDSVSLKFDNNGNFSGIIPGHNYFLTGDSIIFIPTLEYSGTFIKPNDSLLLIKPDTSSLLEYSYATNPISPFPNGDTLYFKQASNDSLTLIQAWVSDGTLKVSMSGLKRIK